MLLDAITGLLGPLESWPTYILQILFLHRPSPARTSQLKKVISFLYGNNVPHTWAYTFFNACSGCTGATARFVVDQTMAWYCKWTDSNFTQHMAEYYDMRRAKFYYINGSQLPQQELVMPEVTSMQFGIDETTHPQLIQSKLEEIRTLKLRS